jgi:hypothetical protein
MGRTPSSSAIALSRLAPHSQAFHFTPHDAPARFEEINFTLAIEAAMKYWISHINLLRNSLSPDTPKIPLTVTASTLRPPIHSLCWTTALLMTVIRHRNYYVFPNFSNWRTANFMEY